MNYRYKIPTYSLHQCYMLTSGKNIEYGPFKCSSKQAYGHPDSVNMLNKSLVSLSDVWVISVAGSGSTGLLLTFHIARELGQTRKLKGRGEANGKLFLYCIYLFWCWSSHQWGQGHVILLVWHISMLNSIFNENKCWFHMLAIDWIVKTWSCSHFSTYFISLQFQPIILVLAHFY